VNEDPDEIMRTVGLRIAELRQALGMTLNELGQKLGVPYQNVQRLERGDQNLTLRTMANVANALGVRVIDLLEAPGSGLPRKPKLGKPRM
jgi:transcriptional regulator with XRE-family HTH domain